MTNNTTLLRSVLIGSTALTMFASPACAQDTQNQASSSTAAPGVESSSTAASASTDNSQQMQQAAASSEDIPSQNDIIVTGSITRNPASATASPVVSLTSTDLANRGITTAADALQLLTANNAGTAPPSWSANGFATGASAPSLRGLNDAYTLTLFNGMRTAVYPLADDAQRNFVDINSIPASIIDRVDTLLDGASATYGSDAIAGVVNVIIKKQITGLHLNGSAGISQRGDAGERRFSATYGYGDLDSQGFNIYFNGEYQKNDPLYLRQRGYPFNTADQSRICGGSGTDNCLTNGIRNGLQADGSFAGTILSTGNAATRPYNGSPITLTDPSGVRTTYGAGAAALGGYEYASPCAGAVTNLSSGQRANINPYTAITDEDGNITGYRFNNVAYSGAQNPSQACQQDLTNQYEMYNARITRKGANVHLTAKVGDNAEAYAMFNYYNVKTYNQNGPSGFTGQTAAGGTRATASYIFLPTYVCDDGVATIGTVGAFPNAVTASGCNAGNGRLNPNNPYAASGNLARLLALPTLPQITTTDAKTYRFSAGIDGTFLDGFNYSLAATTSKVVLNRVNKGTTYLQGLLDAIAQGTYNFLDPSQNTEEQIQGVFPDNKNRAVSRLTQFQGSLNKDLFALPGGQLNVAVIGQYREESINDPSPNAPNEENPYARYYGGINAAGVIGKRHEWSTGYEITAPILDILKLKAEGSYDKYSTGQKRFSPKFEGELRPIEQIKLRGTWSQGFRAPNFAESFSLPSTGYVTGNIVCTQPAYAAFCAAHASNPSYYNVPYSYGLTSAGNPNLDPEKSKGLTGGVVFNPVRNITITVDYWRTKITNVIVPVTGGDAATQYYANNGVVNLPGISITQGVADPQNPGALPLLGTVIGSYKNADALLARGLDFSASAKFPLFNNIQWQTIANASYLLKLKQTLEDGTVQRYDGTLGPCNITSCSGAPKWRAVWQNTLDFNGNGNLSLTAYYTKGYSEVATDAGGVYGDCQASVDAGQVLGFPDGSPVQCRAKSEFNLDGHGEIKIQDKFTLYADVLNILNDRPHYEPNAAYGIYQFNPAWADRQFIGRYFRVGARVDF